MESKKNLRMDSGHFTIAIAFGLLMKSVRKLHFKGILFVSNVNEVVEVHLNFIVFII